EVAIFILEGIPNNGEHGPGSENATAERREASGPSPGTRLGADRVDLDLRNFEVRTPVMACRDGCHACTWAPPALRRLLIGAGKQERRRKTERRNGHDQKNESFVGGKGADPITARAV